MDWSNAVWYRISMIEPNAATPTVLPIDRKKIVDDVAAPICRRGATFWTASVYTGCSRPIPSPEMTMPYTTYVHVVVAPIRANRIIPAATSDDPIRATAL